jgi:hypothetical protein
MRYHRISGEQCQGLKRPQLYNMPTLFIELGQSCSIASAKQVPAVGPVEFEKAFL